MVEFRTVQDVMDEIVAAENLINDLDGKIIGDGCHSVRDSIYDDAINMINNYIELLASFEIKRK